MSNQVTVTFNTSEDAERFRRHVRNYAEVSVTAVPGLQIVDFIPARLEEDGS